MKPTAQADAGRPLPFCVRFALESSDLDRDARATLRLLAQQLRAAPDDGAVQILAFTDTTGSDAYNVALSARRAGHVRRFLVGEGVDAARLQVCPRGAVSFRGDNATRAGRAANRRVEFVQRAR